METKVKDKWGVDSFEKISNPYTEWGWDKKKIDRWNYYDNILNDMMDLIWEYEEDGLVNAKDIKTEITDYFNNLKTK